MNRPRLENRFIGIIHFPQYVHEFIDFSLMKECVVEVVFLSFDCLQDNIGGTCRIRLGNRSISRNRSRASGMNYFISISL